MLQYSPKIVTDSLVMCLDASNNKSYPTDLPVKGGLLLWLDAADDTTFSYSSGTEVSQWRDKSGNNFHANQSSSSAQPSRSTFNNSRKSVNFVAANAEYFLISANPNLALANNASIFIVFKPATQSASYAVLIDNYHTAVTYTGFVIQRNLNASTFYYANGNGSAYLDTGSSQWSYTDNVIEILSLNKSSSIATPYTNGTAQSSATVNATIVQSTTGLVIGSLSTGGRNYNGDMCEILIFNRSLDSTEMKKVHTYLGQKWGIVNTDRQIFDLSGNNFNFAFNGTNPRYNAKTIVSNFNTTTPYAVSSFGGQNLTSKILNLLYSDHTIEVAVNPKGFQSVYNYNNALTTETVQGIVIWTGQHSGLYFAGTTLYYLYWNTASTVVYIGYNAASYQDKIMYINATRTVDTLRLYINGVLVSGPTAVAASTAPLTYTQLNIGTAYQGDPTVNSYVWAGQHEYHLLRMYNRQLTDTEVASNYQAFKARFDNNIVRFGLVLDLDAGNLLSYAGAGSTWYDISGNNNNGTLTNGPVYNTANGGIINFDGTDDYAISTVSSIPASSTVGIWIKSSNYAAKIPLSIDGDSYTSGPNIFFSGNFINWNTGDGAGNPFTNSSYPDSNWHYIVVTNDSTTNAKLYIDGVLIGTAAYRSTASTTSNNFWIGRFHGDNNYTINASIGQTQLYNRALSAAEVLQNYNATKGRFGL